MEEYLKQCANNIIIADAFVKADSVINNPKYKTISCSISGGSDSDVMLDLLSKVDRDNKITYVFFDTGLEYQATKNHIKYLEDKYNIKIRTMRAIKPIPMCVKEYGQPFLSKETSFKIKTLQNNGFDFKNYSKEEFIEKFPKCKGLADWWCNTGQTRRFNIERNRFLKEFLIDNPPTFRIHNMCCMYAKKKVSHKLVKETNSDLVITGVRKAERGLREVVYSDCYTINKDKPDYYRPLFWFSDSDKADYKKKFGITYSDCYEVWGFKRTGCVGCPYNLKILQELEIVKEQEPQMYKACCNIFKDAYEYTKQYREYYKQHAQEEKDKKHHIKRLF